MRGSRHFTAESWACWRGFRRQENCHHCRALLCADYPASLLRPVVAAANIQLATSIPNFLILESIQKMDGFHAALLTKPLCWGDGHIIPPTMPRLGIELNMDVVARNLWDGPRLHLEMAQHPFGPGRDGSFAGG